MLTWVLDDTDITRLRAKNPYDPLTMWRGEDRLSCGSLSGVRKVTVVGWHAGCWQRSPSMCRPASPPKTSPSVPLVHSPLRHPPQLQKAPKQESPLRIVLWGNLVGVPRHYHPLNFFILRALLILLPKPQWTIPISSQPDSYFPLGVHVL